MNGSTPGSSSGINLEEFERRLRTAGAAASSVEDPLEELTRLVNAIASEQPPDDKVVSLAQARQGRNEASAPTLPAPAPASPPPPSMQAPLDVETPAIAISPPDAYAGLAPAPEVAPPTPERAIGLRPTLDETDARRHGSAAVAQAVEEALDLPLEPIAPAPAPGRPRNWYLKVGGLGVMAVVMLAGAVTMKVGGVTGPKTPPLILAADSPTKVAPPSESAVQSPGDTGALLTKDSTSSTPVKVVSNEEQPVDLGAKMANAAHSPVAAAADTPVVAPSDNFGAPPPAVSPTPAGTRIKTVSVRPDGTLIAVDSTPVTPTPAPSAAAPIPAPAPTPTPTPRAGDANPQASTPTLELPPARPGSKTAARVPIAKTDTTAPAEAVGAPAKLAAAALAEKPQKLPTKLAPPPPAPAAVASAQDDVAAPDAAAAPAAGAGGDWSVQLAAPRSAEDAQAAIAKLQAKYGADLAGASLGVHKAEVNGATIYRVRASGMSKPDAVALCGRLKGSGGDCFVARN